MNNFVDIIFTGSALLSWVGLYCCIRGWPASQRTVCLAAIPNETTSSTLLLWQYWTSAISIHREENDREHSRLLDWRKKWSVTSHTCIWSNTESSQNSALPSMLSTRTRQTTMAGFGLLETALTSGKRGSFFNFQWLAEKSSSLPMAHLCTEKKWEWHPRNLIMQKNLHLWWFSALDDYFFYFIFFYYSCQGSRAR